MLLFSAKQLRSQVQAGDDLSMDANGILTFGYSAAYGNEIPSTHGLEFGASGNLSGSYYNPNFLNFNIIPYYNQSRANSSFDSLTDSSGVTATVNLFSGSHFPGYASYRYDYNSTGTFGLVGQPNFTTVGRGQGFGVGWSALIPDWPTLSVSYSQGSGGGNVYGTNEETASTSRTVNVRSSYQLAGWRLSGLYDYLHLHSKYPLFLLGEPANQILSSDGSDLGFSASHQLPLHGSLSVNYNRSAFTGDYGSSSGEMGTTSDFTANSESVYANFHPTTNLVLFTSQSYINNLSGYLYHNLVPGGGVPPTPLGSSSYSTTFGGGASYRITSYLSTLAQATHYNQAYLGKSYSGTYITGTLNYTRRLFNMFTFSGSVIDGSNGQGTNALGFTGNVNYFRRFGLWDTSGTLSYGQNVQTLLITYTTSFYSYSANVHRRFSSKFQWTAAFNGSHTGFTNQPGSVNHMESFTSSLTMRRVSLGGNYTQASGYSLLTGTGIQPIPPTPGLPPGDVIVYNGTSYGGGISLTPLARLSISGTYSHAASDTLSNTTASNNRTDIFTSQLQYRFRRISLLAGFTQFTQGISASGRPAGRESSYFVGVSRGIKFF
jgi:hypothetical protein